MALWRIQRLEQVPPDLTMLTCVDPEVPNRITMYDDQSGFSETHERCWDWTSPTAASDLLDALRVAGYDPSDWHGA